MPVSKGGEESMLEKFKTIYNTFFEIFMWFLYVWVGVIAIGFTYVIPKLGIFIIFLSIVCTILRRKMKNFHSGKEE